VALSLKLGTKSVVRTLILSSHSLIFYSLGFSSIFIISRHIGEFIVFLRKAFKQTSKRIDRAVVFQEDD